MRLRLHPAFPFLLLLAGVVLCYPADAHARGGRFSGPAARAPAPDAGSATEPGSSGSHLDCGQPGAREVDMGDARANASGVPQQALGARKRTARSTRSLGLDDWLYWYEVNREEFEDLRRGAYVTEANPLFALGGGRGARAGRVERRLADAHRLALKTAVRDVIEKKADTHWIFTEGAAYIALGKIATTGEEVELLTRALGADERYLPYVRESAALGLGQLRRSEKRRQLPATTLRRVRLVLTRVLGDEAHAVRTRAFAALSLGLLSDQPTLDERGGKASAEVLFDAWWNGKLPSEVQVGALLGLGLHRPEDVPSLCRIALQACVRRGALEGRSWPALVRAQAALTLGRIGSKGDAAVLAERLRARSTGTTSLTQAAVIAAGTMGGRLPETRADLVDAVLAARKRAKDPAGRRLALMAAARMLALEAAAEAKPHTGALRALRKAAGDGAPADRAFGALALALSVRGIDESVGNAAWQEHRGLALASLRSGLGDRGMDGHARAAFATGLGLARDRSSSKDLLGTLRDVDADPDLRAHAALALGLLGDARAEVLTALVAALQDARSDRLRLRSVTSVGLLGGGSAKDRDRTIAILLAELKRTRSQTVKGRIAITLARIGDARAVRPLIDVLDSMREPHLNRALACAALGLMGDEERTPVLSAARRDCHYLGGSEVVLEVLDVL